eukprot:1158860-Pelagomonas_calceolata.AAC.5
MGGVRESMMGGEVGYLMPVATLVLKAVLPCCVVYLAHDASGDHCCTAAVRRTRWHQTYEEALPGRCTAAVGSTCGTKIVWRHSQARQQFSRATRCYSCLTRRVYRRSEKHPWHQTYVVALPDKAAQQGAPSERLFSPPHSSGECQATSGALQLEC